MKQCKHKNLVGERFGRLVVSAWVFNDKTNKHAWECVCDCGNTKLVASSDLTHGRVTSCGCKHKEIEEKFKTRFLKHGKRYSRLYTIWLNMKQRCTNPKTKQYPNYGGRGIQVCSEWMDSFESFYNWATSNGYSDKLQIDRINNDGNYEPLNCRWATRKEQCANKSNNVKIEAGGKEVLLTHLANDIGITHGCLKKRIDKYGVEDAMIKKKHSSGQHLLELDGVVMDVSGWAKKIGITTTSLCSRLSRWSLRDALTRPRRKQKRPREDYAG